MPPKRILITGASGFIGQSLSLSLLSTPEYKLYLTDLSPPPIPAKSLHPENAHSIAADLTSPSSLTNLINETYPLDAIYIFHGIMSSGSESNFELGMKVNIHATLSLLEQIRLVYPANEKNKKKKIRIIYASSLAIYGPPFPEKVTESTLPTPQSSYGAQKIVCETLIADYTRKGYIDGWSLRFPTVVVRPGKPTQAASSWLSGMVREPFGGVECVVPVVDRGFRSWVCGIGRLVENLRRGLSVGFKDGEEGGRRQVVNLPGSTVSLQEMRDVVERVGGKEVLELVREERDEVLEGILKSWPVEFDTSVAEGLGFVKDEGGFENAVREFKRGLEE